MIIINIDLQDAEEEMLSLGKERASKEIHDRLNMIVNEFRTGNAKVVANPTIKQIGPPMGGELLLVDEDHSRFKEHIDTAMNLQQTWRGLSIGPKISFGVGDPIWRGEPYGPKSIIYGTVVNLTSKLLDVCPSNGIVLTEGAHALVIEYPEIARRFEYDTLPARQSSDRQSYWYLSFDHHRGTIVPNEELLAIRGEVQALNKSVADLTLNVGRLNITVRILCWISGWLALSTMLTWLTLVAVVFWFGKGN